MAIMNDETVTRFRRAETGPRGTGMDRIMERATAMDGARDRDREDGGEVGIQHVAALHRLYDPILNEPVPARMLDLLRRHRGD